MERMKWIEDLDVRGVCTQGIVLDGGFIRISTASYREAASNRTAQGGSAAASSRFFSPFRCWDAGSETCF